MSKLRPIPRSKAKTAWGLVSDVIKVIRAEPKRINMRTFYCHLPPECGGPACGTIGCFAGWVSLLKGGLSNAEQWSFERHARKLLGEDLDYHTVPRRIGSLRVDPGYVFSTMGDDLNGLIGTRLYVQCVVRRIERFRTINEKALRAKRV